MDEHERALRATIEQPQTPPLWRGRENRVNKPSPGGAR